MRKWIVMTGEGEWNKKKKRQLGLSIDLIK